jgi:hypothetical protein
MVTLCRQKKLNLYRYIKNILFIGERLLNMPAKEQTSFLKVEIQAYLFGQFPRSLIRIRIPNTDPDPDAGEPNQCGSESTTLINKQ